MRFPARYVVSSLPSVKWQSRKRSQDKRLFTKCHEAKQSEYQALLDWRNTPTEGLGTSPAQRFLGRRCRTLLPITETLLQPAYDTAADENALKGKRAKQAYYYNRQARDLPPLPVGETVRLRLPGEKRWTAGVCTGPQGPRSYGVQVGDTEYRRNRRHLIQGGEPPVLDPLSEPPEQGQPEDLDKHSVQPNVDCPEPENERQAEEHTSMQLRRSARQRKPPDWFATYVPS